MAAKTTINDFKEIRNTQHITESRHQLSRNFNGVNCSDILTKLIQEAGRWCKTYASDLFTDWNIIQEQIEDRTIESGSYLFGFRENGVDHDKYIFSRYKNQGASDEYRAIWRLDIEVDHEAYPGSDMTAVSFDLYEVGR